MQEAHTPDTHTFTITYHGKPVGELSVQVDVGMDGVDVPHLCQTAATAVCQYVDVYRDAAEAAEEDEEGTPWAMTLRFGDEAEGRSLNKEFRHKDYATNVLSFVADEDEPEAEEWYVGDIFITTAVLVREAGELDKPVAEHLQHLVVHGMLHLIGYDHELGEEEAQAMEALEREIMAELGLDDPYAAHQVLADK